MVKQSRHETGHDSAITTDIMKRRNDFPFYMINGARNLPEVTYEYNSCNIYLISYWDYAIFKNVLVILIVKLKL